MKLLALGTIAFFVSSAYAAWDPNSLGYDCSNGWGVADYIGCALGYTLTAIFLGYIIVRLFYEEKVRAGEYKEKLHNAENEAAAFNITYEDLAEQDRKKAEEEAEGKAF